MQYYLRQHKEADIQGPFTAEDLVVGVGTGRFSINSFASSNLGEDAEQLRKWRRCDWFPLLDIPPLQKLLSPARPVVTQVRRVTVAAIVLLNSSTAISIYLAISQHRRSDWLFVSTGDM